jgi:hypothetical protein
MKRFSPRHEESFAVESLLHQRGVKVLHFSSSAICLLQVVTQQACCVSVKVSSGRNHRTEIDPSKFTNKQNVLTFSNDLFAYLLMHIGVIGEHRLDSQDMRALVQVVSRSL